MKEIILTSRQRMLSSDQLAFELGLIPTAQEIEKNKKISLIVIGAFVAITFIFICSKVYQIQQKYSIKNQNNKITD